MGPRPPGPRFPARLDVFASPHSVFLLVEFPEKSAGTRIAALVCTKELRVPGAVKGVNAEMQARIPDPTA